MGRRPPGGSRPAGKSGKQRESEGNDVMKLTENSEVLAALLVRKAPSVIYAHCFIVLLRSVYPGGHAQGGGSPQLEKYKAMYEDFGDSEQPVKHLIQVRR